MYFCITYVQELTRKHLFTFCLLSHFESSHSIQLHHSRGPCADDLLVKISVLPPVARNATGFQDCRQSVR